jgi:alkylated DNA nucleotide flippase Atl1
MNGVIAREQIWGPDEITARADRLVDQIIQLWPGPDETVSGEGTASTDLRREVTALVIRIPAGRWTSYGDVAAALGSYPQPVANVLAHAPIPGAWRVLKTDGTISPGFAWTDPERTDDPIEVLASEGLDFDAAGRASQAQYLDVQGLAKLTESVAELGE